MTDQSIKELRHMNASLEREVDAAIPSLHRQILKAAGEEMKGGSRFSWLALPIWAGRAAAVAGVAALLIFAVLSPMTRENGTEQAGFQVFRVSLEKDVLVIEWPGNDQKVHRVSRSETPTGFTPAGVALVSGTRWIDRSPQAPGTIYFYRID